MLHLFDELVEIPINDRLIPAEKITRGGDSGTIHSSELRRTGTKYFFGLKLYPWLEFSTSFQIIVVV